MRKQLDVLLVDDDAAIRRILAKELTSKEFQVNTADGAAEARIALNSNMPDCIVLDVRMPGTPGDVFLKELRSIAPDVPVVILTGHANVELAVDCMKEGAADLLTKPCSIDHLQMAIRRACDSKHLREANRTLIRSMQPKFKPVRLIGNSPQMQRLRDLIDRVAATDEPVLIIGESGTGKELIAQTIQQQSSRAAKPFITVNCAAVTETLLESELFGHEKGAFSGADERRLGFFELADEGTIFLDEIGDMPITMQPKLLRVLQSGEFRRVGGSKTLTADVRVIAATNKSLMEEVGKGSFREDLMHRINTFVLEAPPLRDRLDDLKTLVIEFLKEMGTSKDEQPRITEEAMNVMHNYKWPGNIRELRNIVRRTVVLTDAAEIKPGDLPRYMQNSPAAEKSGEVLDLSLGELERRHILAVIEDCEGNKTQAAKRLGVSVKTLYNKFEAWGLKDV